MKRIKFLVPALALFVLFGCGNGGMDEEAPVLDGVQDTAVTVGEDFDPLQGVTATDDIDGDLTEAISIEGTYDLEAEGEYDLVLKVVDQAGNESSQTMKLTVNGSPYGTVSGNITYNEMSTPDTDSRVLLIPQGVDFNDTDMTLYLNGFKTDDQLGVYSTNVDVDGNYELAGVEPGDYFIFVQSENTQNEFVDMEIPAEFSEVFSENNIQTLLVNASFNKGIIETITIEAGQDSDFNYDFGY
ncbi:immunoglobulin-like domain-containing protein [Haloplasma contractile]|uniref:Chitinase protein n=1 Tax=Haloplasma contractile SSD-17B TaxID=1033810 RepID=F7PU97_9MOLU|nr:immunoglobulin-like domain-containing protein [Haloplasma contractile]ERJ11717.1 chitinase protein [Haloplasma contractile SSD-17B]